jgi:hypothetical protein
MSGNDLVRLWKDPDERGDAAHHHPAGEVDLDDLSGAGEVHLTVISVHPFRCPPLSHYWGLCPPPKSILWYLCPTPLDAA